MIIASLWETWHHADDFWVQTWIFVSLTLRSLGVALLIGIPAGMTLTRMQRLAPPIIAVLALLQTIPSLALVGILLPVLGIGGTAAIFVAVVYSLFPVVLNTYVGITQVEPAVRDAARGMGMTGRQVLWRIELPLALPVVLAGVRTGAVYAIGIITICALVGARGLGDYIVAGLTRGDNAEVLLGALPILIITLLMFWVLGGVARLAKNRRDLGLFVGGGLIVLLAGYALAEPLLRPRRADVRLGAKNTFESQILAELLRQLLAARTDLRIDVQPNLGNKLAYQALKSGEIDLYVEYTGNLLTDPDALAMPVPADRSTILKLVRDGMRAQHHLAVLEPFGFDNTYVICLPKAIAEKNHLKTIKTISDLKRVPELRVVVDLSFLKRPDGWDGLVKTYGLNFRQPPQQIIPDYMYNALEHGQAEIVIGSATDWQIAAYDLAILKDDRGYFPDYQAVPVLREAVEDRHPQVAKVINLLAGRINADTMRRLNEQVAKDKRSVREVAREFLRQQGLLP